MVVVQNDVVHHVFTCCVSTPRERHTVTNCLSLFFLEKKGKSKSTLWLKEGRVNGADGDGDPTTVT